MTPVNLSIEDFFERPGAGSFAGSQADAQAHAGGNVAFTGAEAGTGAQAHVDELITQAPPSEVRRWLSTAGEAASTFDRDADRIPFGDVPPDEDRPTLPRPPAGPGPSSRPALSLGTVLLIGVAVVLLKGLL